MTYHRPQRTGSRDELTRSLEEMAVGWDHMGRPDKSARAASAARDLASGAEVAQVGPVRYVVTDSTV